MSYFPVFFGNCAFTGTFRDGWLEVNSGW